MDLTDRKKAVRLLLLAGKTITASYFDTRQEVEQWLRREAATKGILTGSAAPLYFRLYTQPVVDHEHPDIAYVNIPAIGIPSHFTSYTFDDSFHNYAQLTGRPYPHTPANLVPQVLTASEVRQRLDDTGFPVDLDGRDAQRYIECQIWSRELPVFDVIRSLGSDMLHQTLTVEGTVA